MKRKCFIKRLMAHGVPRNRAVAIAELVRAARVPYTNVNVIGLRPNYDSFTAYITFDSHLDGCDLKQRLEALSEGTKCELNKVIQKNREKHARKFTGNPWVRDYFFGPFEFDLLPPKNLPIDPVEAQKYLKFKQSIGLNSGRIEEGRVK